MGLYQRVLGHPFVYDRIRPLVVGGIDWSPVYRELACGPEDIVLDIGCGTGVALDFLPAFRAYHGFDVDPAAVAAAKARAATGQHRGDTVTFVAQGAEVDDLDRIQPTKIVLAGLLHHLGDGDATRLLRMCAACPTVERIVTSDVVYLPGEHLSNALAFLDRGRHVRSPDACGRLVREAGLTEAGRRIIRSSEHGRALYLVMNLGGPAGSR